MRLNGMEFSVEEADRVMGTLPHMPVPDYQVHFKDGSGGAVHVHIEIVGDPAQAPIATIERDLPAHWKLSSTATLKDAIERGLVSGVTVEVVPAVSERGTKVKRFVSHVR